MGLGKFTLDIRTVEEMWVDPVQTALIGTEYIWSQGDNLHQISMQWHFLKKKKKQQKNTLNNNKKTISK